MTLLKYAGILCALCCSISQAWAQSSAPTRGVTIQGPAEQSGIVIKDATGKPCLDVEAAARPQFSNREMLEHVVSVKNNCPRTIRIKLCYYNSEACRQFDLLGYKRTDTTLGVMRGVSFFRYTVLQK